MQPGPSRHSRKIKVYNARSEDLCFIADNARDEDRSEWVSAGAGTILSALIDLHVADVDIRVALNEDEVALCLWGQVDGKAWLIATKEAEGYVLPLHRHLKKELKALHEGHNKLTAHADDRNKLHHKWLEWLGFKHIRTEPHGPWDMPFRYYERINP